MLSWAVMQTITMHILAMINLIQAVREEINVDAHLVICDWWIHVLSSLIWYWSSVVSIWCSHRKWRAFHLYLIEEYFIAFCSGLPFHLIDSTFSTCPLILSPLWLSLVEHFISLLSSSNCSSTYFSESSWSSINIVKHC